MNTPTPSHELDGFDLALLSRLRQEVELRPAVGRRRSARRAVSIAAGVGAVAVAALLGVTSLGSTPAFAVESSADGSVTITIHRLDDATGLEEELAARGIEADVDYDASGAMVRNPRAPDDLVAESDPARAGELCGADLGSDASVRTELKASEFVVTIPQGSPVLHADSELWITTTGDLADSLAGIGIFYTVGGAMCGVGTALTTPAPLG